MERTAPYSSYSRQNGSPHRNDVVKIIHHSCSLPIIGVGSMSARAYVDEKLSAGASLVEVYTAFINGGPGFVKSLLD